MNKVILMGRLTRDPEIKTTGNGKMVAHMSLAVDRPKSNNPNAQQVDYINMVSWEKGASFCQRYLTKGTKILVDGCLQVSTYQDQDGKNRTATKVLIRNIEFCESKKNSTVKHVEDEDVPFGDMDAADDITF